MCSLSCMCLITCTILLVFINNNICTRMNHKYHIQPPATHVFYRNSLMVAVFNLIIGFNLNKYKVSVTIVIIEILPSYQSSLSLTYIYNRYIQYYEHEPLAFFFEKCKITVSKSDFSIKTCVHILFRI